MMSLFESTSSSTNDDTRNCLDAVSCTANETSHSTYLLLRIPNGAGENADVNAISRSENKILACIIVIFSCVVVENELSDLSSTCSVACVMRDGF